jgi:hypothetical protein
LAQEFNVNPVRLLPEHIDTTLGDPHITSSWRFKEACLLHIRTGPSDTVVKNRLLATWEEGLTFLWREAKLICEDFDGFTYLMFLTIAYELKKGKHNHLIVGNAHFKTLL